MATCEYDRALYNFLMTVECSGYDFVNSRPKTDCYNDLQELNKPY